MFRAGNNFTDERETVGMDPRRIQSKKDITLVNVRTGKDEGAFDCTDSETCKVVVAYKVKYYNYSVKLKEGEERFTFLIHPWHFCSLTTNEGTICLSASFDNPFDYFRRDAYVELAASIVIKKI
jgi:hypothetical protein